jgi:predicted metalloprotease with PDZ domain
MLTIFPALKAQTIYNLSFKNAVHHEAEISATFNQVETTTLEVRMSRSSPGRYALHEFAKNVYNVRAYDSKGKSLPISRPSPYQWNIAEHDGTVTVKYTLFADRADGTYSQIDRTHAHLNAPATFIWAKGHQNQPIQIILNPFDKGWKVATQLPRKKKNRYTAPNLDYLMDSPIEMSDHQVSSWKISSNGKKYTIKIALHHRGNKQDLETYTEKAKAVVREQVKVFGELPDFDYSSYTFIACYLPHVRGDGMEHRNSTIITSQTSLDEAEFKQLGTLSHEFFHAWNVERIRPKSLQPFDFSQHNMTKDLWFAEGFTSYYGPLTIRRAKQSTVAEFIEMVTTIVNQAQNVPGRKYFSPEGASMMATFTDAGTSIDRTNFNNTFFSYYIYGRAMAMALDLSLRSQFKDLSLDNFMQQMWLDFGKNEIPYTRGDLIQTLIKITKDKTFSKNFFETYIFNKNTPDFKSLLLHAGLIVEQSGKDEPYLGNLRLNFNGEAAMVANGIAIDTPLYKIGVEQGDQIVQLGRRTIRSNHLWSKALEQFKPGDTTNITFIQRGETLTKEITFISNPEITVSLLSNEKQTDQHKAFISSWIGEDEENKKD